MRPNATITVAICYGCYKLRVRVWNAWWCKLVFNWLMSRTVCIIDCCWVSGRYGWRCSADCCPWGWWDGEVATSTCGWGQPGIEDHATWPSLQAGTWTYQQAESKKHNCAIFYRAMLCMRGTSHGPVSVCPSVCQSQVGVLLKRLNVGSHKQHHMIAQGL